MSDRWLGVYALILLVAVTLSLPTSRRKRSSNYIGPPCDDHPVVPCVLERNPPNSRLALSDIYDVYGCTEGGNEKDGYELHVLSVFFAVNNEIKLKLRPVESGVVKKVRLVLMSHDPVTWTISTTGDDIQVASVDLISFNLTQSPVSINGRPPAQLTKKPAYWGFGRRRSELKQLREHLHRRGYGEMTSYSGSVVAASDWTLRVGNNYDCQSKQSSSSVICQDRSPGFHDSPAVECHTFVLCLEDHSYEMKCRGGLRWSNKTRQCELEDSVTCGSKRANTETDLCLKFGNCWSKFPFKYDESVTPCRGDQLTLLSNYGLYVGVVLCNETTYSILLAESLAEKFLPIGDERGHGEDHCEFISASSVYGRTHWHFWNTTVVDGFYRSNWGEMPKRGRIGMGQSVREWTGRFYPKTYQCDKRIPGDTRVEEAPLRLVSHSEAEKTVRTGESVTLNCAANYADALVEWYWVKEGKDEDNLTLVTPDNTLQISRQDGGSSLSIADFSGDRHAGTYQCRTMRGAEEDEDDEDEEDAGEYYTSHFTVLKGKENTCDLGLSLRSEGKPVLGGVINPAIGGRVSVTCQTSSHHVETYQWRKDGSRLEGEDGETLSIACFTDRDVGEYECRAIARDDNSQYCMDTTTFTLMPQGCGYESASSQTRGGHRAVEGSVPWMVVLSDPQVKRFCGGVILNKRWVATAAHCMDQEKFKYLHDKNLDVEDLQLRLNFYSDKQALESFKVVKATEIIIHPKYNPRTLDNDLALLKLEADLVLNVNITSTCLHSKFFLERNFLDKTEEQLDGKVAGWGVTEHGHASDVLKQVTLPLVHCSSDRQGPVKPTNNMFCAGDDPNEGTCKGDSGSPFVMSYYDRWYLVGLVSWGSEDCDTGRTHFTRVPNYVSWIREQISHGMCEN